MTPSEAVQTALLPALALLPGAMNSPSAQVQLLAIAGQESNLEHRWQVIDANRPDVKGPARGLLQFELGSEASRGGVWGVYLHRASHHHLLHVCRLRGVECRPEIIWRALETDDVLAFAVGRLLLWTDPRALPAVGDEGAAFDLYTRTWRPGAYWRGSAAQRAGLRSKWRGHFRRAMAAIAADGAA